MDPQVVIGNSTAAAGVVPEPWEIDASAASPPARRLPWWLIVPAAVGVVIAPTRFGPRIGCSSVWKALAVFLVCTIAACAAAFLGGRFGEVLGERWAVAAEQSFAASERLRVPFVLVIDALYDATADLDWKPVLLALGSVLAVLLAAPWILPPLIAARGERWRMCVWRALKLVLWSTAAIVPGVLLVAVASSDKLVDWYAVLPNRLGGKLRTVIAVELAALLWMSVLARLGIRGPGGISVDSAPPRCTGCGYILTGLPMEGRCPECGRPVGQSAPGTRRLPAWATARNPLRRLVLYPGTLLAAVRGRTFFERLAVYRGREAALRFANWNSWLGGVLVGVTVLGANALFDPLGSRTETVTASVISALAAVILLRLSLPLAMLVTTRLGWRIRERPAAVPVLYSGAAFLPLTIAVSVGLFFSVPVLDVLAFAALVMTVALAIGLAIFVRLTRRALRATRYASE